GQGRARQLVDLEGDGDRRDLAPQVRDGLPDEQQPKLARLAKRRQVDGQRAEPADHAGTIRRYVLGFVEHGGSTYRAGEALLAGSLWAHGRFDTPRHGS